jgi:hypothetical protein
LESDANKSHHESFYLIFLKTIFFPKYIIFIL